MERYRFSTDPTGNLARTLGGPQFRDGEVTIDEAEVRVVLGTPPAFSVTIPRSSIRSAERIPPIKGATRGVHGMRGKWLVNLSRDNLVRLTISPAATASFTVRTDMLEGAKLPKGRIGKALMRRLLQRDVQVRRLTVGVEEPDALVAALAPATSGSR